jgi:AraC family carnitine catabolism transcriptional activator
MESAAQQPSSTAIGFVLIPRFNMMALTATIEPLRIANYISGRSLYSWAFLSPDGERVMASNGMALDTCPVGPDASWASVFVCGSWNAQHYDNRDLLAWLRRMERLGVAIGAMDVGVYILARAGLLDGCRATIHWYCQRAFAEEFPKVEVSERLYVVDRNRTTIAGGIAGLDAMLDKVRREHGDQLALEVADQVMHHPIREGDAPQRHALGGRRQIAHPVLRKAIEAMEGRLDEPLAIPDLAAIAGVSQRRLERLFRKHMGTSAIGYYRMLRLELARVLLTHTSMSIRDISVACGFASLSHFAKSFASLFGKRPSAYREAWPETETVPIWPGISTSLMEAARSVAGDDVAVAEAAER